MTRIYLELWAAEHDSERLRAGRKSVASSRLKCFSSASATSEEWAHLEGITESGAQVCFWLGGKLAGEGHEDVASILENMDFAQRQ
jgi:hypothetical protein